MPAIPFEAVVRQRDGAAIVDCSGDIDAQAAPALEAAYAEAAATPTSRLLLGFDAVEYINSTGIALIVALLARARAAERQVGAFGLSEHYREIFTITRLADFMVLYPDEDAAFGGPSTAAV